MIHIDKQEFDSKCKEVIQDIKEEEIRSPAWAWIAAGAFAGFVASCVRFNRGTTKPFLANYTKTGEGKYGQFKRKRNM